MSTLPSVSLTFAQLGAAGVAMVAATVAAVGLAVQLSKQLSTLVVGVQQAAEQPRRHGPTRLRQHQTRLSSAELHDLIESYNAGATISELAELFAIHRTTVMSQLDRAQVPRRVQGIAPEQHAEVVELYQAGWSLARLRERLGADDATIRRVLVSQGVTIRPRGRQRRL